MRYQDQQTNADQPDVIASDPVPVPPSDPVTTTNQDRDRDVRSDQEYDGTPDRERAVDDALDDQGTFDDPVVADTRTRTEEEQAADATVDDDATFVDERARADAARAVDAQTEDDRTDDRRAAESALGDRAAVDDPLAGPRTETGADDDDDDDRDRDSRVNGADQAELAQPAPQPTVFGAATVGGAAAASAMAEAGYGRAEEHNVRDEDTAATGDGAVDDQLDETRAMRAGFDQAGTGQRDVDPVAALFAADTAQGFRDRWREVQLRFVDDPHTAVGEAQALVEEAVESLAATLATQKNDLGGWQAGGSGDTEQLRVVVRRYRDFLDRLLGL